LRNSLAISNIAWPAEETPGILAALKALGFDALEIAPSRLWTEPVQAPAAERRRLVRWSEDHELPIVSIHSLFYTRPDLGLFRDRDTEQNTIRYLHDLGVLAAELGARVMVFGSPRNRRRGGLPMEEALRRAAAFFHEAACGLEGTGVCLVIEPLRPDESDFINTSEEGRHLVEKAEHPLFQLHLDAKSVAAEPGDFPTILRLALPHLRHFHVNDPGLGEVGATGLYHEALGAALRSSGYDRCVSIEMKTLPGHREAISRSASFVKKYYLGNR